MLIISESNFSLAIDLGYDAIKSKDEKYIFLRKLNGFDSNVKLEKYLNKLKEEKEILSAFDAVRAYFINIQNEKVKEWGMSVDQETIYEHAQEISMLALRNIIETDKNRINRLSMRSTKSSSLLRSNQVQLVEHENMHELINEVNLWLEDGRYVLHEIKLVVSSHENFSTNVAILVLSDEEQRQLKIDKLAEQGRCIDCGAPVPQDGMIWEKCRKCSDSEEPYEPWH